ncbi:unnamed protein product [Durusdinium trenchii]|uniref:Uncharacterized protein n=2 Tax=Durusdinium trenchii TaxID=1381693 RepID=A0ABP0I950_9DINO
MQGPDLQTLAETLVSLDEQSAVSVICSVLESRPELAPSVVTFSVPDLTYPPIRAITERRSEGVIKTFYEQKGYGFITCEELQKVFGNDVFLVGQQFNGFQVGQQVTFAVALNKDNKPQAYDLRHHTGAQVPSNAYVAKGAAKGTQQGMHQGANQKGQWQSQAQSSTWGGQEEKWKKEETWNSQDKWQNNQQDKWGGQDKSWNAQASWPAQSQQWTQPAKRKDFGFQVDPEKVIGDYQGYIKSFNPSNGYGFIVCEALKVEGYTNDVFLHSAQFTEGGFMVGAEVEFTAFINGKNQPQAIELRAPGSGSWGNKRQRNG